VRQRAFEDPPGKWRHERRRAGPLAVRVGAAGGLERHLGRRLHGVARRLQRHAEPSQQRHRLLVAALQDPEQQVLGADLVGTETGRFLSGDAHGSPYGDGHVDATGRRDVSRVVLLHEASDAVAVAAVGGLFGDTDRSPDLAPGHSGTDRIRGQLGLDCVELATQLAERLQSSGRIRSGNHTQNQSFHLGRALHRYLRVLSRAGRRERQIDIHA